MVSLASLLISLPRLSVKMTASNSFSEGLKQAVRGAVCFTLGQASLANSWAAQFVPPTLGGPFGAVEPIRRLLCSDPSPNPVPLPPFVGGQCDCARYVVQVNYTYVDFFGNTRSGAGAERFIRGPLTGVAALIDPNNPSRVRTTFKSKGSSIGPSYPPCGTVVTTTQSNSTVSNPESVSLTGVTIVLAPDGDDCGDPPPVVDDYDPVPVTRPITYINIEGDTVTELGDFVLLAPVIIGGNLIAPVTVNIGAVKIPVRLNISTGDISFGVEAPDTPTSPVDDNPVENPGMEDEKPVVETLLRGVVVYASQVNEGRDKTTLVAQLGAPSLRLPRVGNVWFQIPFGERTTWLGPFPVQSRNQLVMVPEGLGAVDVKLVASSGWNLQGVPLARPACGCDHA